MYIKNFYLENIGPLKQISINPKFDPDGNPLPVIIVGSNGAGKTNVLSLVADALLEVATAYADNAVANNTGLSRPMFRVIGGSTVNMAADGSFCVIEFEHDEKSSIYWQKSARMTADLVGTKLPDHIASKLDWSEDSKPKSVTISSKDAEQIFNSGAYVFFPASRSEVPDWLNTNSLHEPEFDLDDSSQKRLRKPIFVERGLEKFKQWMLSLLIDTRMDVSAFSYSGDQEIKIKTSDEVAMGMIHQSVWGHLNAILKVILLNPEARFSWAGRHNNNTIFIEDGEKIIAPSINALSGGQATLLNIFTTLMRYGDKAQAKSVFETAKIEGICVIDEIDAHMHVDMQYSIIPALIAIFPKVQFIISCHSPLFILGMSKHLGNKQQIIELPSGQPLDAEAYEEFGRALDVMKATNAFNAEVAQRIKENTLPTVLLEGETDLNYFNAAIKALGYEELFANVKFDWIGTKNDSGVAVGGGASGLDAALRFLRDNPQVVQNKILLLYDNDANKADSSEEGSNLIVRSIPKNDLHEWMRCGIESLLPEELFSKDFYNCKTIDPKNGKRSSVEELDKQTFCNFVCSRNNKDDYVNFDPLLKMIHQQFFGTSLETVKSENIAAKGSWFKRGK